MTWTDFFDILPS